MGLFGVALPGTLAFFILPPFFKTFSTCTLAREGKMHTLDNFSVFFF